MQMKPLVFTLLLPFCLSARAEEKLTEVEIPVREIFAPSEGYDNNDNVEIVIDTNLPDLCYRLGRTDVSQQGSQFVVHQFAFRSNSGTCAPGNDMTATDDDVIAVTSLGALKVGQYTAVSSFQGHDAKPAAFAVSEAISPAIDSLPYANVTSLNVGGVVKPGQISVEISGTLQDSCRELVEPIVTKKLGDVIIVLPTQKHVGPADRLCTFMMRPFRKMVAVDNVNEGKFLVHVRARNGKSVNQLVEVRK